MDSIVGARIGHQGFRGQLLPVRLESLGFLADVTFRVLLFLNLPGHVRGRYLVMLGFPRRLRCGIAKLA